MNCSGEIASVARAYGTTDHSIYRWREKYGGMECSEIKDLGVLQVDNQRLKLTGLP